MIESIAGEEWRDVVGYEERYRVSSRGRVMSNVRKEPIILKGSPNNYDYLLVGLRKNGKRESILIHRLVLLAFKPVENSSDLEGNHKDFDKTNNCIDNLEWTTKLENVRHFLSSGRPKDKSKTTGSSHHLSQLTDEDVLEIRRLCSVKPRQNNIVARQFGISESTVRQIVSMQTWQHLIQ